jgi:hypothetical protein
MKSTEIKLGGTQFEFRFGLSFLGSLIEEEGKDVEELLKAVKSNPFRMVPLVMFKSAETGARRNKVAFDYDLDSFTDLIDDEGGIASEAVSKFLEAFTSSMTKDVPKQKSKGKPQAQSKS